DVRRPELGRIGQLVRECEDRPLEDLAVVILESSAAPTDVHGGLHSPGAVDGTGDFPLARTIAADRVRRVAGLVAPGTVVPVAVSAPAQGAAEHAVLF